MRPLLVADVSLFCRRLSQTEEQQTPRQPFPGDEASEITNSTALDTRARNGFSLLADTAGWENTEPFPWVFKSI